MGQAGFETVLAAHHGEVYRYLLRATGRASDADDLSQETFLRAYRAFRSLSPEANARAWLYAIATNLVRNHFRAERRRRMAYAAVSLAAGATADPAPEAAVAAREAGAVVETIIGRLPLKQRLAFIQRKLHGLDYEAIGKSLGCSAESARAHVFQALRKIRQGLNGHGLLSEVPRP
jgi:RNA polymerase sigma-70 factor (ECF subfamily)